MKIHRISLVGFGPYRDAETVDFSAFDDDGIFLIAGKTGAGKTSILDAITFALFGSVPRYDTAPGDGVRSDFIEPTDVCQVTLEFSTAQDRYRVTRSTSHWRPSKRGAKQVKQEATIELAELIEGTWQVIETKLGNAERSIVEMIHLDAKQFQQVILLAQGQFQEFLVADSDKRRDLLRQLFDSKRFSNYSQSLEERARVLRADLGVASTAIATNVGTLAAQLGQEIPEDLDASTGNGVSAWTASVAAHAKETYELTQTEVMECQVAHASAKTAFNEVNAIKERQTRLAKALARQSELEKQADGVAKDRLVLAEARKADLVEHALVGHSTAADNHTDAEQSQVDAIDALKELLPETAMDEGSLASLIEDLTELRGRLRDAETQELALDDLTTAHSTASQTLDDFDVTAATDRTKLVTQQGALKDTNDQIATLKPEANKLAAATAQLTEAKARLDAAASAQQTRALLAAAMTERLSSGHQVTEISKRRDALHARQLSEFAGVLAAALEVDQPCQVCGSTSHPFKATLADDHVDEAQLDTVGRELDAAEDRTRVAEAEVTRLETLLDTHLTTSGGQDLAELIVDVDAATRAAQSAATAKERLEELTTTRDGLHEAIETLRKAIDSSVASRSTLVEKKALASQAVRTASQELAAARGTYPTVTAHRQAVGAQHLAATNLRDAQQSLRRSTAAVEESTRILDTALANHGFADVTAVAAASATIDIQEELEERINKHAAATSAVTEALASDELQGVPTGPVDLEAVLVILNEAENAQNAAIAANSAAQTTHNAVKQLANKITEELKAVVKLQREYDVVNRLANTVRGQAPNTMKMTLEAFALAAELEEIIKAANVRLRTMTSGRYEFEHSDALAGHGAQSGLALRMLDAHTGDTRSPQSLSGGEKFQASLALALGLAEVVTSRAGGLRLDTLFIDEGFGSLDPGTLETTMATLDNLKEGGRTIGLISHVEAMKESIPAQLFVDVTPGGWSTIRQE
jgi:exonuclease SbcC